MLLLLLCWCLQAHATIPESARSHKVLQRALKHEQAASRSVSNVSSAAGSYVIGWKGFVESCSGVASSMRGVLASSSSLPSLGCIADHTSL